MKLAERYRPQITKIGIRHIYLEQERVGALSPELAPAGYLKNLTLVFDRIPQDTNQRFPHVPVERITDKHQPLPPQPLQHISWVQSNISNTELTLKKSNTELYLSHANNYL